MKRSGYKLWIEYLKRSRRYKWYCDVINDREFMRNFNSYMDNSNVRMEYESMNFLYSRFGNIHHPDWSFDEWYESISLQMENPVGYGEACILTSLEKDRFGFGLGGTEAVLRVSIDCRADFERITQELRELIEIHKREADDFFSLHNKIHLIPLSNKRLRIDELKRYLKVFDLKEGQQLKMAEVVSRLQTLAQRESQKPESVLRVFRADLKKAKQIIENTEKGLFPGEY